jgi:hypothetical protein
MNGDITEIPSALCILKTKQNNEIFVFPMIEIPPSAPIYNQTQQKHKTIYTS